MRPRRPQRECPSQSGGIIFSVLSLLFAIVLGFTVYLVRHPLLRLVGESWIVEDTLEPSDAIIVLSDDNFYADRATRAAQIYRQGVAPVVVASGRKLRPYAGIAELMEHDLVERGVPKDKVIRVPQEAQNTREEAIALSAIARERRWRSVIVVTSNYHTRRARYIFAHVFPAGTAIHVTSARDGDFEPERWWENRLSLKEFAGEVGGMMVAMWELRHQPG